MKASVIKRFKVHVGYHCVNNTAYILSAISVKIMDSPLKIANLADIENKIEAEQLRVETWKPLKDEIQSLMDTLCELDDDKIKSVDIIAEHTERIINVIPSKPLDIWYPKPIHDLLSVRPLQRTEFPLDVLKGLVSSGFDVNEYHNSDGEDVNEDFCEEEDIPDEKRMTCLHLAIKNHHYSAARWLVQHGADCDKESYDEFDAIECYVTPISMLAMNQNAPMDLIDLLITDENINSENHRGTSLPLHFAALYGHTNIALHLIEQGAKVNKFDADGYLPLHLAIIEGHTDLTLSLIEHGASVNQEDGYGDVPLHLAAIEGHTDLALSLIKHGASVNHEDGYGDVPLHLAVSKGHTDVALSLIKHGASVNQEDKDGNLPWHVAVREGDTAVALLLIEQGANVNQANRNRDLPLHVAASEGHTDLALSLIKYGASVNQEDGDGDLPLQLAVWGGHTSLVLSLIKHGASVNQEDGHGDLPMRLAVSRGHTDVALSLIKHGASMNQEDEHGYLPLHTAVYKNNSDLALPLIEQGANVNRTSRNGELALHLAVSEGHTDLALSLIQHGASVNQEDGHGYLPVYLAVSQGHTDIALALIKHGASVNHDCHGSPPVIDYVMNYTKHCASRELFTRLIPESNMDILKTICNILQRETYSNWEFISWMLHQLIQHLMLIEPLAFSVEIDWESLGYFQVYVELNENTLTCGTASLRPAYLCSKLLMLLGCDASCPGAIVPQWGDLLSAKHLSLAQSIGELWHTYKQKHSVKTLQTLCIQKIRQSMVSLTDESFQCLPVPSRICKSLMLHDVADDLCEAYLMWENIRSEDLM